MFCGDRLWLATGAKPLEVIQEAFLVSQNWGRISLDNASLFFLIVVPITP